MKRYLIAIFIILIFMACINKSKKTSITSRNQPEDTIKKVTINKHGIDTLEEEFIDSTDIGVKKTYKLELKKFRGYDSIYVNITLFEKRKGKWCKKQELNRPKDGVADCDVKISDFNNDGINDMTFVSAIAARGANEVRSLFIFDKKTGTLIFIKNSENYPNMLYNKKLNCIDALLVSGSFYTAFLRLEKDSLREFIGVDVRGDKLNIITTDKHGQQKDSIIDRKNTFGEFVRFKNFKPLQAY